MTALYLDAPSPPATADCCTQGKLLLPRQLRGSRDASVGQGGAGVLQCLQHVVPSAAAAGAAIPLPPMPLCFAHLHTEAGLSPREQRGLRSSRLGLPLLPAAPAGEADPGAQTDSYFLLLEKRVPATLTLMLQLPAAPQFDDGHMGRMQPQGEIGEGGQMTSKWSQHRVM